LNRKNIRLMYAVALLQGMVFYGPVATLYRQAQGVTIFQITLIESISLALCLLLEIPWGIAADRIGYRRTMVFCCFLYAASKIVFWRASGFAAFLLERVMLSVVIAGLSGVDVSILWLSCEKEKSQRVFGVYGSLQTTGLLVAAAVYSAVIGTRYRLAGFLTVVSYGLAALLSLGLTEVRKPERRRFDPAEFRALLRRTLGDGSLPLLLAGTALFSEAHQTVTVFLNQPQYVKCGLSPSAIGWLYLAATLAGTCGFLSSGLTRRLGERRTGELLLTAGAASCALLAFTGSAFLSALAILVLRVAFGLFQPLQTELQNRQITGADRATALSVNAMAVDCVGVGTNVVFGALAEKNLPLSFFFGAGLCIAAAVLFALWFRKRKK
jgi:predicted MFS family arabinose efflux permease